MDIPEEYPKILYKYRNWEDEFHKNTLINAHLFLSSPKYFNDPLDCRIPINYTLLNTKERIADYAKQACARLADILIEQNKNIENEIAKIEYMLMNDMEDFQKRNEKLQQSIQDKHHGILSLTKKWNSILMWSHYGNFHKGYCIGFWCEKLVNSNYFGKGGPVLYDKIFPQIDPIIDDVVSTAFKQSHYKAKKWKYEKEFRFTKLFFPNEPSDNERIVPIPNDFIAEVIIGLNTPKKHEEEILLMSKKRKVKTFKIIKIPFKFQLERVEI